MPWLSLLSCMCTERLPMNLPFVAADVSPRTSFRTPDRRRLTSAATVGGRGTGNEPAARSGGRQSAHLPPDGRSAPTHVGGYGLVATLSHPMGEGLGVRALHTGEAFNVERWKLNLKVERFF